MVLRKDELETKLKDDHRLISAGVLRNEHPLDLSKQFEDFLQACRRGDLKACQEFISGGVNINGKDQFDYTPLVIASLCGHYELVQLLLESGALADPDSFERERAVYNALNHRIRNLLLSYDYSKSADPLQPWSSHITSLLTRDVPRTWDIELVAGSQSFYLHKFVLSARSPYFRKKFIDAPELMTWRMSPSIPVDALHIVLRYLYLGDLPRDLVAPASANHVEKASEEEVARGIDKLCRQLEIDKLWEAVLSLNDRRLARQRHQDEVQRAQGQVDGFFRDTVMKHKMVVDASKVKDVKWPHDNAIFANCLLRADEEEDGDDGGDKADEDDDDHPGLTHHNSIPIGPGAAMGATNGTKESTSEESSNYAPNGSRKRKRTVLYPAHKAFLIRSPVFERMFAGQFLEAQDEEHLHVIHMDCTPAVAEIILAFLYTEKADCTLDLALDLLYTADYYMIDKLKAKAALTISTLGSGNSNALVDRTHGAEGEDGKAEGDPEPEPIDVYDVIHAAWELRVQRLEEFAARYLASRLEDYIDEEEFAQLIKESAERLKERQETDTIELLDDIRYYLSERFRLRFEGDGMEELLDEEGELHAEAVEDLAAAAKGPAESEDRQQWASGDETVSERTTVVKGPGLKADGENLAGAVRTLDGELVEDEFVSDALNYQILLGKIDAMLERLKLDA